jgi:hypothetical protein
MSTIIEIEKLALDLPDKERATLVANLLDSLPGILSRRTKALLRLCAVMRRLM